MHSFTFYQAKNVLNQLIFGVLCGQMKSEQWQFEGVGLKPFYLMGSVGVSAGVHFTECYASISIFFNVFSKSIVTT